MEKRKCKLCSKSFSNGRALGGHMRSHLATTPVPGTEAIQHSPSLDHGKGVVEEEQKGMNYVLRENPKRSFRLADPEFSFTVDGSLIQDRESETESFKNPTRRRSKRNWKLGVSTNSVSKKRKTKPELTRSGSAESLVELEIASSVSDATSDEGIALCLMMLSRDKPVTPKELDIGSSKIEVNTSNADRRIYECQVCFRVFGSGQALGGHKRVHQNGSNSFKVRDDLIDLNLPAPIEDESFSMVELSAISEV